MLQSNYSVLGRERSSQIPQFLITSSKKVMFSVSFVCLSVNRIKLKLLH